MKSLWQVNVVVGHDVSVPDSEIMASLALDAARLLSGFYWKGSAVVIADVQSVGRLGEAR